MFTYHFLQGTQLSQFSTGFPLLKELTKKGSTLQELSPLAYLGSKFFLYTSETFFELGGNSISGRVASLESASILLKSNMNTVAATKQNQTSGMCT